MKQKLRLFELKSAILQIRNNCYCHDCYTKTLIELSFRSTVPSKFTDLLISLFNGRMWCY